MKKSIFLIVIFFIANGITAQSVSLSKVEGKVTGLPVNGVLKGIVGPAPTVKAFNYTMGKIIDAAFINRSLAGPVGYDVKVFGSISKFQPQLGEKRNTGMIGIFLYNYIRAKDDVVKRVDESPATIKMYLNSSHFFSRRAGFFDAYDERLQIQHPFQQIKMSDSTSDYIEYSFKNYPFNAGYYRDFAIRIIRKNDKPVFIPFSRKQYLKYLIAVEDMRLKDLKKDLQSFKNENNKTEKRLADPNEKYKEILQIAYDGTKKTIAQTESFIEKSEQKISSYKQGISKMTAEECNETAYVDMGRKTDDLTAQLVDRGRREGHALYIVNPNYYDDKQPPYKTQSVMVVYWYDPQFCPPFLQERIKQIVDGIDYHQIKESMK